MKVCLNATLFQRNESIVWDGSKLTATAVSMDYAIPRPLWLERGAARGQCREGINTHSTVPHYVIEKQCPSMSIIAFVMLTIVWFVVKLTGELFHFQGWKKGAFYQFNTRTPSHDTHALLMTSTGFIPLKLPTHLQGAGAVPSLRQILHGHNPDRRRETYSDFETFHCKQFNPSLKSCQSHIWPRDVEVLLFESTLEKTDKLCEQPPAAGISLVVATSSLADDVFSGVLEKSLMSYEGDQVTSIACEHSFCDPSTIIGVVIC
jgi:hypothetical protein